MNKFLYKAHFKSPLGDLLAIASNKGLISLSFEEANAYAYARIKQYYPDLTLLDEGGLKNCNHLLETKNWLKSYFLKSKNLPPLPLMDIQGSPFAKNAWKALLKVKLGQTQSYGTIAKKLKNPKASRAIGQIVGANPIVIIIPCHRIIGSNGTLTGYGGGLRRKIWLLEHEGLSVNSSRVIHERTR